jgi:hypothetical protein
MTSGAGTSNLLIVEAFRAALRHQLLIVAAIFLLLRLTSSPAGEMALLTAATGHSAELLAAWTTDGMHWSVSSPLSTAGGAVQASGFAAARGVWMLLANGQVLNVPVQYGSSG